MSKMSLLLNVLLDLALLEGGEGTEGTEGMQIFKEIPVAITVATTPPGACAMEKQDRGAKLWEAGQHQLSLSWCPQRLPHHPTHTQAPFLVAMEGGTNHRPFPKVSSKCQSRES